MSNVSIFVTHAGCKQLCSFCNQRIISGQLKPVNAEEVKRTLEKALENPNHKHNQIAFFGGSFTAIGREYMAELLEAAKPYLSEFDGIRISTRPDAIDEEILDFLKHRGVKAIELGAQSLDDEVLKLNRRGHTAADVFTAGKLIKDSGFELGLQMMTGLYGDSDEKALETAKKIVSLAPATVRIYPTVVLEGTELAELYKKGVYKTQTLEEAINLCVKLIEIFETAGIKIIRLGLHESEEVRGNRVAGAYHPAFKELCLSRIYFNRTFEALKSRHKGEYKLFVAPKSLSQMIGQKKENINKLAEQGYKIKVFSDETLGEYELRIEE